MFSSQSKSSVRRNSVSAGLRPRWFRILRDQWLLLVMALPALLIVAIFCYGPMYGIQIAFKDYKVAHGILGSEWVGLKHFTAFFQSPMAARVIKNTLLLGLYNLLWGFPAPILLALMINELDHPLFKKVVQTITYLPYFISSVIIVGLLKNFASIDGGLFNQILGVFGVGPINFFGESGWFRTLYIGSGIWQGVGWGTIIYLAAMAGVDMELHDAAAIDGCNRLQRIWNITLPAITPTISVLLILNVGSILGSDFQKIMLMYNPGTYSTADVINTYVYREGIEGARFSYSTAVGLFTSIISFVLLVLTNYICRKLSDVSLW